MALPVAVGAVTGEIGLGLLAALGGLPAARPILRVRNYTLYSVVMTPLIVILLEFGAAPSSGVLLYRLADMGTGFLIAVVVGALLWSSLRAEPA